MRLKSFPTDDRLARFTFQVPNKCKVQSAKCKVKSAKSLGSIPFIKLDLDNLTRVQDQHINKHLKDIRDDLNFECPLKNGGTVKVRILVEHKSHHDSKLWQQIMGTVLWEWKNSSISPILPVVLHTGKNRFHLESPRRLLDDQSKALEKYQPDFAVIAIDASQLSLERIEKSQNLDAISKLILGIFILVQREQITVDSIRDWLNRVYPHINTKEQRAHLSAAITYIRYKTDIKSEEILSMASRFIHAHPIHPDSVVGKALSKGREEGIAIGEARGITLGEARRQLEIAKGMLSENLPLTLIQKLTGIAPSELEKLV